MSKGRAVHEETADAGWSWIRSPNIKEDAMVKHHMLSIIGALLLATAVIGGAPNSAWSSCQLNSFKNNIQHVVYIEFDNVHFTRDDANVPSDLEQMPNLLNFITEHGTLDAGDHAVLISHTANDILTTETGVYSDRDGIAVANSFGVFGPQGPSPLSPNGVYFPSSFFYWTDLVEDITPTTNDALPALLTESQATMPAPWVPFTRAGCDVGAFSTANIVIERTPFDVVKVFGPGSTEALDANQFSDFAGEAVHCAIGSALCAASTHTRPDLLPDEPGGYSEYSAIFGAKYLAEVMGGQFEDLNGNVLNGFGPISFSPTATQTLGAVATMLEHGVPVVFAYIADAHDGHVSPFLAFGPGQAGYEAQLAAYNDAFGTFFQRLKGDGIDQSNTLFIFTPDEGDHFVGGPPSPVNCDGVTTPCTYSKIGEEQINLAGLVANAYAAQALGTPPSFSIHSDDAPTIYLKGQPMRTDPAVRQLEQVVGGLTAVSAVTGNTDQLTTALADPVEERMLHMVTADPARTPTLTLFGDPDYFFMTSGSTTPVEGPGFAWNHGDIQPEIARTFIGIVGPGVLNLGVTDAFFSDHVDVRPTILSLVGLTDDYAHDGRVLTEVVDPKVLPSSLHAHNPTLTELGQAYKQINAPFGQLAMDSLAVSTAALESDSPGDETYVQLESQIAGWTSTRDSLAGQMKAMLENAEFNGQPIDEQAAKSLIAKAGALLADAHSAANP
jgi:hypothetical protein